MSYNAVLYAIFFFIVCVFFLISCVSHPEKLVINEEKRQILALPEKKEKSDFTLKDSSIITDLEIGSPATIRRAVGKLRQTANHSFETENILLYLANEVYKLAYPSERKLRNTSRPNSVNPYLDILDAVHQGVYQFNVERNDFFSLLLPTLVLFTAPHVYNYYDEAESNLLQAIELRKDSVLAHYLLGLIYQRKNEFQKAEAHLETAYLLDTDIYDIAIIYAQFLLRYNPQVAYDIGQIFVKKNVYTQELYILCTEAAIQLKNWENAEKYISQVLQSEVSNTRFLLLRIQVLIENKDYLKASSLLDTYENMDKIGKQGKDYLLLRSRLQYEWNRNIQAALSTLEQALSLYPEDLTVLTAAANLSVQTNQTINTISAEDIASAILEKDANNLSALSILIADSQKKKAWKQVLDLTNKYLAIQENTNILIYKAWAYYWLNQSKNAFDLITLLFNTHPQDENIQQAYIKMHILAKRTKEAANKISTLLPTASLRMKSSLHYYQSLLAKNSDAKLNDLRMSLTANPRNIEALFDLYSFYFEKKDYRKAHYYLRQVVALDPANKTYQTLETQLKQKLEN